MRKWYQRSRKRDGWVERKRRFRKLFTANVREVAVVEPAPKVEKVAAE